MHYQQLDFLAKIFPEPTPQIGWRSILHCNNPRTYHFIPSPRKEACGFKLLIHQGIWNPLWHRLGKDLVHNEIYRAFGIVPFIRPVPGDRVGFKGSLLYEGSRKDFCMLSCSLKEVGTNVGALSVTLEVILEALHHCRSTVSKVSEVTQAFDLRLMHTGDLKGGDLSVTLSPMIAQWIRTQLPHTHHQEAEQVMRASYATLCRGTCSSDCTRDSDAFKVYFSNRRVCLSLGRDRTDLRSTEFHCDRDNHGQHLTALNVYSFEQQIALLMGVAALCQRAETL